MIKLPNPDSQYKKLTDTVEFWLSGESAHVATLFDKFYFKLDPNIVGNAVNIVVFHNGQLHTIGIKDFAVFKNGNQPRKDLNKMLSSSNCPSDIWEAIIAYINANEARDLKIKRIIQFIGMLLASPANNSRAIAQLPPIFRELGFPPDNLLIDAPGNAWQEEGIALILAQPALDLIQAY